LLSNERLSGKPILFKSFTGLTIQDFDNIYNKQIVKKHEKYELKRLSKRKDRKRDMGAVGRPFNLDLKNRFSMLLVYYRLYITYTLTGFLFDFDLSKVCRDIQKIENLVMRCVPIPQKIYKITKRLKTIEEVEKYFPGILALIYSTEQQIPRPADKNKRKIFYSGKKKRHTVKNQLTVNKDGHILHKATYKEGWRHDYDVYKKNHPVTPKQVVDVIDLGYIGVEKDFPEQLLSALPCKKKRNYEMSQEEKDYNKIHSNKRGYW
jgi:hypothetical protein